MWCRLLKCVYMETIESKGIHRKYEQVQYCSVYLWGCGSHRCWWRQRNGQNRVQPEIKIADVKPEILAPEIAVRISVKLRQ